MGFIARVGHFTMLFRCGGPGNSYMGADTCVRVRDAAYGCVMEHTYETVSFR